MPSEISIQGKVLREKYRVLGVLFFLSTIISFLLLYRSNFVFAAEVLDNAGLITRNIWYSKDPFFAGDKIRIYSVIFNGSKLDLRGRINFYDRGYLLCTSEFAVLSGRVSDVWCNWAVKEGKHSISIKITNPRGSLPGGDDIPVVLSSSELGAGEVVAEERPIPVAVQVAPNIVTQTLDNVAKVDQAQAVSPRAETNQLGGVAAKVLDFFGIGEASDEIGRRSIAKTGGDNGSLGSNKVSGGRLDDSSSANRSTINGGDTRAPIDEDNIVVATSSLTKKFVARLNNLEKILNPEKKQVGGPRNSSNNKSDLDIESSFSNPVMSNLASVWEAYKNFMSRVPYLKEFKDTILAFLKSYTTTDSKPTEYIALFIYTVVFYILESPVILTLIWAYLILRVFRFFMNRRRRY